MTAIAFDLDQPTAVAIDFERRTAPTMLAAAPAAIPTGIVDTDCNRHLGLHIALLAPVSAALWAGMGWTAYRLLTMALG